MRIGIVSDTHDDMHALGRALDILEREGIDLLLHCGDLCGPEVMRALTPFDAYVARGNMDRHNALEAAAQQTIGAGRFADRHTLMLDGASAALMHGHHEDELRQLISSGEHAYVFHGHTHRGRDQRVGPTRVINPGALGGVQWQRRSFCILDLSTEETEFIAI